MPQLNAGQLLGIVTVLVPAIRDFIARRHAATGQIPTIEEITAHVNANADGVVSDIDSWEAANPIPVTPAPDA